MKFKLALANLRSNKKIAIINVAVITLSLTLLMVVTNLIACINDYKNYIREVPENRTLMVNISNSIFTNDGIEKVDVDKKLEAIRNIPHVSEVIKSYPPDELEIITTEQTKMLNKNDGWNFAYCMPYNGIEQIKLIEGKLPTEINEIIIPQYFQPNENYNDRGIFAGNNYFKGEDFIGKELELVSTIPTPTDQPLRTLTIKAKVVGTYDASASNSSPYDCYLSLKTFEKMHQDLIEFTEEYENNSTEAYVLIDKFDNVQSVRMEFERNRQQYFYNEVNEGFSNFAALFTAVCVFLLSITVFVCIFSQSFLVSSQVKKRKKQIAIFKSIGYSNSLIRQINLIETAITTILSVALSYILSVAFLVVFWEFTIKTLLSAIFLSMTVNYTVLLVSMLAVALLALFVTVIVLLVSQSKITKISVANAIKG